MHTQPSLFCVLFHIAIYENGIMVFCTEPFGWIMRYNSSKNAPEGREITASCLQGLDYPHSEEVASVRPFICSMAQTI
jgi:hypothetical protein